MKLYLSSWKKTTRPTAINSVRFVSNIAANKLSLHLKKKMGLKSIEYSMSRRKIAIFLNFAEFVTAKAKEANLAFYEAIFSINLPR